MIFKTIDITTFNKEKTISDESKISIDKRGNLLIMDKNGQKILWSAERARVEEISACGIFISCFIHKGFTRQGIAKFEHRDIFCSYQNK